MSKGDKNLEINKTPLKDEELIEATGGWKPPIDPDPFSNDPDRDKRDQGKQGFFDKNF